jgi:anti-sigma-K factor RskA
LSAKHQEDAWAFLERVGSYVAGELEREDAREIERLILENPDYRRLVDSYSRMLVMLSTLGSETVEAPSEIVGYAVRRAYVSAFLRQVQQLAHGLVGDYLGALAFYLGLRPVRLR